MLKRSDKEDLDPRLRPYVEGLNTLGYTTLYSCSGHKKGSEGYITLLGKPCEIDLRNHLKYLRLSGFRFSHGIILAEVETTTIVFPGLGGSKGGRKLPPVNLDWSVKEKNNLLRLFSRNLHRVGIPHMSHRSVIIRYALSQALMGKEVSKKDVEKDRGV